MTLFEMAEEAGRATGVMSTARVTHATPSATYAHIAEPGLGGRQVPRRYAAGHRAACKDIADQLVSWPFGDGFELRHGGGRSYFLPESGADPEDEGKTGRRKDGRNLTEEWTSKSNNHPFVFDEAGLTKSTGLPAPRSSAYLK